MRQVLRGLIATAILTAIAKGEEFTWAWWPGDTPREEIKLDGWIDLDCVAEEVEAGLDELRRACSMEVSERTLIEEKLGDVRYTLYG